MQKRLKEENRLKQGVCKICTYHLTWAIEEKFLAILIICD